MRDFKPAGIFCVVAREPFMGGGEFARLNFPKRRRTLVGMGMTIEQVTDEALALPSEARALLADRLAESLDPAEGGHIHDLWVAEARRRRDEVRSGRVKTIPSDEAMAKVLRAVAK
jgi:putative addiction module component (TIGR02574 family)